MGRLRPRIVLFGDSITEFAVQIDQSVGWGSSLMTHYSRKADVLNRGFGGYNTRLAALVLDKIFPIPSSDPPLLVTVNFGANDACIPNAGHGMVHVPLAEYTENTRKIVAHLKKLSDSTNIVLMTPPPVSEKNLLATAPVLFGDTSGVLTRRNEVTKLYAEECVKVAKEANVPVIDIWSSFQEAPDWEEKYLCDGLHLSAEGNAKLFGELVTVLDDPGFVPTLKPDQMLWDFPHYTVFGDDPTSTVEKWLTQANT